MQTITKEPELCSKPKMHFYLFLGEKTTPSTWHFTAKIRGQNNYCTSSSKCASYHWRTLYTLTTTYLKTGPFTVNCIYGNFCWYWGIYLVSYKLTMCLPKLATRYIYSITKRCFNFLVFTLRSCASL